MHDRAALRRKIVPALPTAERLGFAVRSRGDAVRTAIRAANTIRPAPLDEQRLSGSLVGNLSNELFEAQPILEPHLAVTVGASASRQPLGAGMIQRNNPRPFTEQLGNAGEHHVDQIAGGIQTAERPAEVGPVEYGVREVA